MANLPPEILLNIARQNSAAGRALHLADPTLSGLSTPEQRLAWYCRKDRQNRTWIETPDQCLRHNYADPTPFPTLNDGFEWCRFGLRHRENDQPAFTHPDGDQSWYQNDELHRDGDQPACIYSDGDQEWYQNDELHRDDHPITGKPQPAETRPGCVNWYWKNNVAFYGDDEVVEWALDRLVEDLRKHHAKFITGKYSGANFNRLKFKRSCQNLDVWYERFKESPAVRWGQLNNTKSPLTPDELPAYWENSDDD